MALNLVRFKHQEQIFWGVLENHRILQLSNAANELNTTDQLISLGIDYLKTLANPELSFAFEEIELLSPITENSKIICQGANYRQHMLDSGINPDEKKFNMFFTKSNKSIHSPNGFIEKPKHVQLLDYEIELCLIIKQKIDTEITVTQQNLHEYIAGICIGNDVSARDIQIPETQFFKGKSYPTFCPFGPVLCLLEQHEMHYLNELMLTLKVNGQIRQQDSTANMVFKPAETLTEMSQIINFQAGDVIMTGTPSGCALSLPSPLLVKISSLLPEQKKWNIFIKKQKANARYLNIGDHLELQIQSLDQKINLGTQQHKIKFL